MYGPYQMVSTSIAAIVILVFFLAFNKYIWPKKNLSYFTLLILISILPIISIFRPGVYESGDFNLHIYEAIDFYESLTHGIIIPRWGSELNATYGYPVFLFSYPLPFYLLSFFHFIGFSYVASMKIFLILSYVLSGITMYFLGKSLFGKLGGFISSIFYLFAPYHLVDLHFRVAIGEVLAFVFMPLVFLFTAKLTEKSNINNFTFLSFSVALLILSHQAVSLNFIPIAFLYGCFLWFLTNKKLSNLYSLIVANFAGVLLSAFYWIPVLIEKTYTFDGISPKNFFFEKFQEFFLSSWRYGLLHQGPEGQLSFAIGYIHWVVVLVSVFLLFKSKIKKEFKNLLIFSLLIFLLLFFMMQQISLPIWETFSILKNFQFSYRILAVIVFFASLIASIVLISLNKKHLAVIVCIIVVLLTILNWGNRRMIPEINDAYLINNVPYSTAEGELNGQSIPKWVDPNKRAFGKIPPAPLQSIDEAKIVVIKHEPEYHKYLVSSEGTTLVENTLYFPGWKLLINGKPTNFNYLTDDYLGRIVFEVPKGRHTLEVIFEDTTVRKVSEIVSSVSFLTILSIYLLSKLSLIKFIK